MSLGTMSFMETSTTAAPASSSHGSTHIQSSQETGGPGTYVFIPIMSVTLNKSLSLSGAADIDHSSLVPAPGLHCSASGGPQASLGVCLGSKKIPFFSAPVKEPEPASFGDF